jgi:hypothetical protein
MRRAGLRDAPRGLRDALDGLALAADYLGVGAGSRCSARSGTPGGPSGSQQKHRYACKSASSNPKSAQSELHP